MIQISGVLKLRSIIFALIVLHQFLCVVSSENSSVLVSQYEQVKNDAVAPNRSLLALRQEGPVVVGQLVGGRSQYDLAKDVTGAAWDEMPDCSEYNAPGTCVPGDPFEPCLYCKAFRVSFVGTAQCPPKDSFPVHLRALYEWRLKTHKKKTLTGAYQLCVAQPAEGPVGSMEQAELTAPFQGLSSAISSSTITPFILLLLYTIATTFVITLF